MSSAISARAGTRSTTPSRAWGVDALAIGGVSIAGVPYFARDLSRERALSTQPIDVVLGRDLLFRWRVLFMRERVRLGGPEQYPF